MAEISDAQFVINLIYPILHYTHTLKQSTITMDKLQEEAEEDQKRTLGMFSIV